jgi:hypothetical protein
MHGRFTLRFGMAAACLLGLAVFGWPTSGSATTMLSFTYSGEIIGGENPGFIANATVVFEFDETCVGTVGNECGLQLTLRYDASGPLPSQGEVLTGVLFEPLGSADFRDGPPGNVPFGGVVGGENLVGNGNVIAGGELGGVIISGTNYFDVSSHWGLNPAMAVPSAYGSHYFASVGDVLAGMNVTTSTLGSAQLFGNSPSSLEPLPPNGSFFGIVALNQTVGGSGFPMGNIAYVQDEVVANILYLGTLDGIDLVRPTFGTEGNPVVPEPSTALLLGGGLLVLMGAARRARAR